MNCASKRFSLIAGLLCGLAALGAPPAAHAQSVRIAARFTPEEGRIVDAAVLANGHIALLYPEAGRIADHALDGKLHQHITREAGVERRFRPTACIAGPSDALLVFDEAAHKLFRITPDGNIVSGIDLAYPAQESQPPLALSRIGDLAYGQGSLIWTLLPEKSVLAGFNAEGSLEARLELATLLPYTPAVYTRAQLLPDGSLYILDYHQGAIIYRSGPAGSFKRLRLAIPEGLDAAPTAQDFAVDPEGNILVATYDEQAPLLLLSPGETGYRSHRLELDLPDGSQRLACRSSAGKFVVWWKDEPLVLVLELR